MAGERRTAPAQPLRRIAPTRRSRRASVELGVLNKHLGYFVRRLQVWVFQDFIRTLATIDISPAQFSVLVVIGANRELSQAELAATLGIERARMARVLQLLERRGLVKRRPSASDSRSNALALTTAGRTALGRAKSLAAQHESRLIQGLGAERHADLIRTMREFQPLHLERIMDRRNQ